MDKTEQFILFLLTFLFVIIQIHSKATTHLIITRVGPCKTKQQYPFNVSEFHISRIKHSYNFSISGEINLKSDIENGWTLKMTVEKCLDIRNEDTCEFFKSADIIEDGCNDDENFPIDTILDHFQPKLTCPLQAGEYRFVRYPFITKDHFRASKTNIASSFFGYIVNSELMDDSATYGCVNMIFRLWYVRKHDWGAAQSSGQNEEVKPDKNGGDSQIVLLGEDWGGFGSK